VAAAGRRLARGALGRMLGTGRVRRGRAEVAGPGAGLVRGGCGRDSVCLAEGRRGVAGCRSGSRGAAVGRPGTVVERSFAFLRFWGISGMGIVEDRTRRRLEGWKGRGQAAPEDVVLRSHHEPLARVGQARGGFQMGKRSRAHLVVQRLRLSGAHIGFPTAMISLKCSVLI
jgi:hypothetical protein